MVFSDPRFVVRRWRLCSDACKQMGGSTRCHRGCRTFFCISLSIPMKSTRKYAHLFAGELTVVRCCSAGKRGFACNASMIHRAILALLMLCSLYPSALGPAPLPLLPLCADQATLAHSQALFKVEPCHVMLLRDRKGAAVPWLALSMSSLPLLCYDHASTVFHRDSWLQ